VPGCLVLVIAILAVLSFEPQKRLGQAIKTGNKKVLVDVWISIVKRPKAELPARTLRKANDFARRV